MNPSVWRLLLTCLLLITLSLKGWAAVGSACATGHHQKDGSAALPAQMVMASAHLDLHDHPAFERHGAAAQASHHLDHQAQAAGSADAVPAAGGDQAQAKCSGCAPCSMGAALTCAVFARIPALPAAAELPAIESHYLSVDLLGLERPPRAVSA
jgi:hypothetical protein